MSRLRIPIACLHAFCFVWMVTGGRGVSSNAFCVLALEESHCQASGPEISLTSIHSFTDAGLTSLEDGNTVVSHCLFLSAGCKSSLMWGMR
jgi:hypothetical protein